MKRIVFLLCIALTACRETPTRPPSSAWLQPRSARNTLSRFSNRRSPCHLRLTNRQVDMTSQRFGDVSSHPDFVSGHSDNAIADA